VEKRARQFKVRFINQFTTGYGNYTQERQELFAGMTPDGVKAELGL